MLIDQIFVLLKRNRNRYMYNYCLNIGCRLHEINTGCEEINYNKKKH